jgi:amidase
MATKRRDEEEEVGATFELSRRTLLRWSALAGAGATVGGGFAAPARGQGGGEDAKAAVTAVEPATSLVELSIAEMQAAMAAGTLSSAELVRGYLQRITSLDDADRPGPGVNSIVEVNPQALEIARRRDRERHDGHLRGPLHGIPIVLKENIDTADRMQTTAGSLALLGSLPTHDATVVARLRAAGAVILGKANLSEWANFRSFQSSSGWSGRGGQTRNPYVLDRNPCGSSAGSGAAVSASFCAAALGTETDGSIVCPASINGVVGIKPTVGLTSRAGVIPISHTQDTVGPHGRTVADAAAVLGALTGVDPRDPATAASAGRFHADYTQFLDPDGLNGARIGVFRNTTTGYSPETDAIFEVAVQAMEDAGAVLVDPADVPTIEELNADSAEIIVLVYEFKRDLAAYLATRPGLPVANLADLIAFNIAHADREMPYFGQELFELADADLFTEEDYLDALARGKQLAATDGIDAVLAEHDLDALVAPTGSPSWPTDLINGDHFLGASSTAAAVAGYPMVNVPAGFSFGLPVGISFIGTAWSEPTLIKLASGFEHVTRIRRRPRFLPETPANQGNAAASIASATTRAARIASLLERVGKPGTSLRQRLHSL